MDETGCRSFRILALFLPSGGRRGKITHHTYLKNMALFFLGTFFFDTFSVTGLYSVDDRVTTE
jgi:hypothetical protein